MFFHMYNSVRVPLKAFIEQVHKIWWSAFSETQDEKNEPFFSE